MSDNTRCRGFWVYLLIAAVVIGWIGVRTQITANQQERQSAHTMQLADQAGECLHELLDALQARSQITEAADRLNNDQHKVLADLITAITAARGEAAYGQVLTQYLPLIINAQKRQEALLQSRSTHPLPDPSCSFPR